MSKKSKPKKKKWYDPAADKFGNPSEGLRSLEFIANYLGEAFVINPCGRNQLVVPVVERFIG